MKSSRPIQPGKNAIAAITKPMEVGLWQRLNALVPEGIELGEIKARSAGSLYVDLRETASDRSWRVSWRADKTRWEDLTGAVRDAVDGLLGRFWRSYPMPGPEFSRSPRLGG